jgi:uncharacterized RDD family membrane protein YckC
MTDAITPNPFAPPRAHVEDQQATQPTAMVLATRGSRFLAVLVDISPIFVLGILAAVALPSLFMGKLDAPSSNVMIGLVALVFFVATIGWLIWNIVLLYRYGQTIGKKVLGIRVVRMDGSRVSFPRFFFLRWLAMAVIGGVFGGIASSLGNRYLGNVVSLIDALMIFGASRRCLHDLIADTRVVTAASSPNATLAGAGAA